MMAHRSPAFSLFTNSAFSSVTSHFIQLHSSSVHLVILFWYLVIFVCHIFCEVSWKDDFLWYLIFCNSNLLVKLFLWCNSQFFQIWILDRPCALLRWSIFLFSWTDFRWIKLLLDMFQTWFITVLMKIFEPCYPWGIGLTFLSRLTRAHVMSRL